MNIVVYTQFISERFPLLVDFCIDDCSEIEINTIRLIRQVVTTGLGQYARPDGFYKGGPVYEAVYIHGYPGCNNLLSPFQLVTVADLVAAALPKPHSSIQEDCTVHPEINNGKP